MNTPNPKIEAVIEDAAKRKAEDNLAAGYDVAAVAAAAPPTAKKQRSTTEEEEKKRQARLESNRKAARESRRRKKVLVEELQRSVIFFTRANAQLKQKNEGLEAMLFAARSQIEGTSTGGQPSQGVASALTGVLATSSSAAEDQKLAASAPQAPVPVAAAATGHVAALDTHHPSALPKASVLPSNNFMTNWFAMAQATGMVPNPMAVQMPPLGMFTPAMSMAAAAAGSNMANPAIMGMAANIGNLAGIGSPYFGQLQASGQLHMPAVSSLGQVQASNPNPTSGGHGMSNAGAAPAVNKSSRASKDGTVVV